MPDREAAKRRENVARRRARLGAAAVLLAATWLASAPVTHAQTILKFATKQVPDGNVGIFYRTRVMATGGTAPYTWRLVNGTTLPAGLTLKRLKGIIVGTPTTVGTATFTVQVRDALGARRRRDFTLAIGDTTALVELVSVNSLGAPANSDSGGAALSSDGRFVAFTSFGDNLAPGDTNGAADIYLRDRLCGVTIRASVGVNAGLPVQGKAMSFAPAVSSLVGPTLFVAYASDSNNIVPGDTNQVRDVFVTAIDVSSCTLTPISTARVSVGFDKDGNQVEGNGLSNLPTISADGTRVAYHSQAANLVPGDGTSNFDVFLTEIQFTGGVVSPVSTERVSTTKRFLALDIALNLPDTLADIFSKATIGNSTLTMTPDEHKGRLVKIVAGTGAVQTRAVKSNTATTITVDSDWTTIPNATSVFRVITGAQKADIFSASTIGATTLPMTPGAHVGQLAHLTAGKGSGQRRLITGNDATTLTVSPDWATTPDATSLFRILTPADQTADIFADKSLGNSGLVMGTGEFIGDLVEIVSGTGAGQAQDVSVNSQTTLFFTAAWDPLPDSTSVFRVVNQGSGSNFRGRISPDGSLVAFHSDSPFSFDDTNGVTDIYSADGVSGFVELDSVDSVGTVGDGVSNVSALSGDGHLVLFESGAKNLVAGDTNKVNDLFLHDRLAGTTERVSLADDESEGDGNADVAAGLSGGGRLAAFSSFAANLVPGDRNQARDVFLRDRTSGTTTRVSLGMGGVNPNGESFDAVISLDGSTVAFTSGAKNLVLADANAFTDVYVTTTSISDPPMLIATRLPLPTRGRPYAATLAAVGGTQPLAWALTEGALPPGLFLDPSTGQISGLPQQAGSYTFTVLVMDSDRPARQAARTFTLIVKP